MTRSHDQPAAVDHYIEHLVRAVPVPSADRTVVNAGTAHTARALHSLAQMIAVPAGFERALQDQLIASSAPSSALGDRDRSSERTGPDDQRKRRLSLHSWPVRAAAAVVLLAVIGGGIWASSGVRAHLTQLACFVPGLGIRACESPGLVAPKPVSVVRDGVTMTVTSLLSANGETTVRVDVAGLREPVNDPSPTPWPHVYLRRPAGQQEQGTFQLWRQASSDGTWTVTTVWRFSALDPGTRVVDVEVDAAMNAGPWTVQVPLVPVDEADLPVAQEQKASETHHDVTVGVQSVVADQDRTVVQVTARTATPDAFVKNLGADGVAAASEPLTLEDDQGRQLQELPPPLPRFPDVRAPAYVADLFFPPLAADARTATLSVPMVTIQERTAATTVRVPVAGVRVGDHIPLPTDYMLGPYPFRITDAEIVEQDGEPWLLLRFDFGDWNNGRIVAGSAGVSSPDVDTTRVRGERRGDAGQWTELSVPLPPEPRDEVSLVFRDADVVVQGPWHLELAIR